MNIKKFHIYAAVTAIAVLSSSLSGCASNHPQDPFEKVNRIVFAFNEHLDRAVLKPIATGYQTVVPEVARTHIGNFFGNTVDVWSTANAGFQLKPEKFLTGVFRVGVNTIFGFGGLIDIATEMGLDKPQEDLGQTLGYWGIGPGPYIVWPVLGPSNVRDSVGRVGDYLANPVIHIEDDATRFGLLALGTVHLRSVLIGIVNVTDEAALDRYIFLRDAFMQRRQNLIYDGAPPLSQLSDINDSDL